MVAKLWHSINNDSIEERLMREASRRPRKIDPLIYTNGWSTKCPSISGLKIYENILYSMWCRQTLILRKLSKQKVTIYGMMCITSIIELKRIYHYTILIL